MIDLKTKSALVIDGGMFLPLAELLSSKFSKLGYFSDWQNPYPDAKELIIGSGLDGITREKYLWDVIDGYDLIIFPDVRNGDLQDYLRAQGKRVWGAGRLAALELNRWKTKQLMEQIGLPVNESEKIAGLENLRSYLQQNDDVYIKISNFRGLGETFHSENYDIVRGQLDDLRDKHGVLMDIVEFIVEKSIPDAVEDGYGGFCIDGEFPNLSVYGCEVKDKAYFGKFVNYDDLPEDVRTVNTKLSPSLNGYRQFFSTELRNGVPIDFTVRQSSPEGEAFCHAFDNIADIIWYGSEGTLVEPKTDFKFIAQIILCSDWAEDHWAAIQFPEAVRPFVKLYNHCRINGQDYVVPQLAKMKQIGSVVGTGKTPKEACDMAKKNADAVKGFDLDAETESLDKALKLMEDK